MNDPSGSQWRKWDLHFHTPKSHDHGNKGLTASQVVDRLVEANIAVVAVTDHHALDAEFIDEMRAAANGRVTVLPGIELTSNLGGSDGIHFIAIFSEASDLQHLSSELMSKLELATKRQNGVEEERLYVEFPTSASIIQNLHGIISVHGHRKHANIETISNHLSFKQQVKTDLLRDWVDIIDLSDRKYASDYLEKVFPNIGFELPLIVGSDDHARADYPMNRFCWIKADPTFAGLLMALREPRARFCLDDTPESVKRIEKNKTKYIKSISFSKLDSMPPNDAWLQGEVPLNPGLVAVIGNKGSGKSALLDCIGLLASCSTSDAFSFLDEERFRHPKTGRAQHVEATLHWHDGEPQTRQLDEYVAADEPERVKYLPQNFVEKVCNDLASPGGGEFERELKKVVFSKVALADRLGKRSLDDLVQFRTHELRQEADSLALELQELGSERARMAERLDPEVKSGLEKKIERVKEEIKTHEAAKPGEKEAPPEDPATTGEAKADLDALNELKGERESTINEINKNEAIVGKQQLRAATAKKLLDKLDNLQTEIDRRIDDMFAEADALGFDVATLATLTINRDLIVVIRDEANEQRNVARELVDGPAPDGLNAKRDQIEKDIKEIQDRLSRPNREYQIYLEEKAKWEETLKKLQGTPEERDSLAGLQADLDALDTVPQQIEGIQQKQEAIAKKIHELRVDEASIYTELYEPVQRFISEHPLAKDHLKLEFKVELVQEGFVHTLLSHLNQNRAGSFRGEEEGKAVAKALGARVDWSEWDQVRGFLEAVVDHLSTDRRSDRGGSVLLKDQVGKGKTVADLYTWLYGLTYVKPRYLLRWDGKDVEQLSPGERGTLLLIFYLLVDDSDLPLIIDQPEANLDNTTVAEKLVDCIRDACERRQVIIVTHNPNLAVVCDADQIIHATLDRPAGNKLRYETGALEHPNLNRFTINVLEGGRVPFDIRDNTYQVAGE